MNANGDQAAGVHGIVSRCGKRTKRGASPVPTSREGCEGFEYESD